MKKHNGHTYYGNLVYVTDAMVDYDNNYIYPIESNGLQGESGVEFLNKLLEYNVNIHLDIDTNRDGSDTVFISFDTEEEISMDAMKNLMELIFSYSPSEFNFNANNDCLRIWWD
jgi:hypothetical protein